MAHDTTERAIRTLFDSDRSLAERVVKRLRKKRAKARNDAAIDEIVRVNGGYFILPYDEEHDDRLPEDGPEQLRLDLWGRS
jgi:hypothetical protein